jgi:hypothetical protein
VHGYAPACQIHVIISKLATEPGRLWLQAPVEEWMPRWHDNLLKYVADELQWLSILQVRVHLLFLQMLKGGSGAVLSHSTALSSETAISPTTLAQVAGPQLRPVPAVFYIAASQTTQADLHTSQTPAHNRRPHTALP